MGGRPLVLTYCNNFQRNPDGTNLLLYSYQTYARNIRYHVLSLYMIHLTQTYIKIFKCSNYFFIPRLFVTVRVHILSSGYSDL